MKITKEQLNQMIQEELDAYLSETDEDMDLTFEGEEEEEKEMDDMPAEAEGEGDNEELMASLRNLYDVLQGMFGGEEAPEDEIQENAGTSGMTVQQLLGKLKSFRPEQEVLLHYLDTYGGGEDGPDAGEGEGPLRTTISEKVHFILADRGNNSGRGMSVKELMDRLENAQGTTKVFMTVKNSPLLALTKVNKKDNKVELYSEVHDLEPLESKKAEDKEDLNESVTINRFKQLANIRG
jgi:hypothetical protein